MSRLVGLLAIFGFIFLSKIFIESMMPTKNAYNEAIFKIDIESIKPGTFNEYQWNNNPLIVFRTDKKSILQFEKNNSKVWGPDITKNNAAQFYVYIARSTFKGCGLLETEQYEKDFTFLSGWWDPCHIGTWDYSGRHYISTSKDNKLRNLEVVNYRIREKNIIQILP